MILLTILEASRVHHSRGEGQEEDAVLLVLGAVLGDDQVEGRLAGGVQRPGLDVKIVREGGVRIAGGEEDDLLGLALEDEREEQVGEVDVGDDVDLGQLPEDLGDLLGPVGTVLAMLAFYPLSFLL